MKDPLTIEEQAAQLARWLDEHPGSAPPEGVDPDVLETIYALRPDLAPAPSFSIDDILADVSSGPFAAIMAEADADEPEVDEPLVVDLATERKRRRPWLWSGLGAMAAAAMALIVAIPQLKDGISDEALYAPLAEQSQPAPAPASTRRAIAELEEVREPEEPAEATIDLLAQPVEPSLDEPFRPDGAESLARGGEPADATELGFAEDRRDAKARAAGAGSMAAEKKEASAETGELAASDGAIAQTPPGEWYAPYGGASSSAAPAAATRSPAPAPPPAMPAAEPAGPAPAQDPAPATVTGGSVAGLIRDEMSTAGGDADYGAMVDWEEDESLDAGAAYDLEAPEAEGEERSRESRKQTETDLDDADDNMLESERRSSRTRAEPESTSVSSVVSGRYRGTGRSSAPRADRSRDRWAEAQDQAMAEEAAPMVSQPSIDQLRGQANPLDYHSEWYLSDAVLDEVTRSQIAAAYGRAQGAVVAGDPGGAVSAMQPLLGSAHPRVVQDAAFRIATLQLQQGQRGTALATVDRGLAASSSPTVHRSRLLAMRGSILEEQGDSQGAIEAYQQAMDANATRY